MDAMATPYRDPTPMRVALIGTAAGVLALLGTLFVVRTRRQNRERRGPVGDLDDSGGHVDRQGALARIGEHERHLLFELAQAGIDVLHGTVDEIRQSKSPRS